MGDMMDSALAILRESGPMTTNEMAKAMFGEVPEYKVQEKIADAYGYLSRLRKYGLVDCERTKRPGPYRWWAT